MVHPDFRIVKGSLHLHVSREEPVSTCPPTRQPKHEVDHSPFCFRPPTLEDQTSSQQPCPSTDVSHSQRSCSSDSHQRLPHLQAHLPSVPQTVIPELPTRRLYQQQPVHIPQRSQSQPADLTQVRLCNKLTVGSSHLQLTANALIVFGCSV